MLGDELFERAFRERPETDAILYFDTAIAAAEATARARALAAALRAKLGLAPGERVALMLQNVPAFPIAVQAVWRCGGVITSVNPMNKEGELRHQLLDSGARVVICLESLHPVVVAAREGTAVEHVITVSELEMLGEVPAALAGCERRECAGAIPFAELAAGDRALPAVEVDPDSPAALSYTSGTTGQPKGAINTHRALAHTATAMRDWGELGEGDVTMAMAPLFHITGLACHLVASQVSATPLLLMNRFDAGEFLRLVERWRGTYVIGPLTAFIAILDHPSLPETDLSSLTKSASGGAPVYATVVERWERTTGSYLHNTYGLTETAAPSHLVQRGERSPIDAATGALSIGRPIAGNQSRVVRVEDGTDAPDGEEGEILTRGPAVVPGYWQRPEESAAAIEDGWLHTGDVGKRDADGWYYLVDRIKDMIIVSGYKVWPREVEDVLFAHPAVAEAAVVGAADDYRGEVPVAHVVVRPGADLDESEVIAFCRERLAVYKAPRRVAFATELPKTATGKTLRRQLRDAPDRP